MKNEENLMKNYNNYENITKNRDETFFSLSFSELTNFFRKELLAYKKLGFKFDDYFEISCAVASFLEKGVDFYIKFNKNNNNQNSNDLLSKIIKTGVSGKIAFLGEKSFLVRIFFNDVERKKIINLGNLSSQKNSVIFASKDNSDTFSPLKGHFQTSNNYKPKTRNSSSVITIEKIHAEKVSKYVTVEGQ